MKVGFTQYISTWIRDLVTMSNQTETTNLKVFDRHRFVGVIFEYVNSPGFLGCYASSHALPNSIEVTLPVGMDISVSRASRVVLSVGAFVSPAILEKSGISVKPVLEKCGLKQRVYLPDGVSC